MKNRSWSQQWNECQYYFIFSLGLQLNRVWLLCDMYWETVSHPSIVIVCRQYAKRVYCDKIAEVRITRFPLKSSPQHEFSCEVWWRNLKLPPRAEGSKYGGMDTKHVLFSYSRRYVWEIVQIRALVTLNRKSYISFQLAQQSMTLTDLERPKRV